MTAGATIAGVRLIRHPVRPDARGSFAKLLHPSDLPDAGGTLPLRESFVSWSHPGVLRGMHFQSPPAAHDKAVTCLAGRVLDVVLDLRRSSPTHGKACAFELSGEAPETVWVPVGCAHGFLVLGDAPALLHYSVTAEHSPENDRGVRWDSFGFAWPASARLVSDRDRGLPALAELDTPFA